MSCEQARNAQFAPVGQQAFGIVQPALREYSSNGWAAMIGRIGPRSHRLPVGLPLLPKPAKNSFLAISTRSGNRGKNDEQQAECCMCRLSLLRWREFCRGS